MRRAVFSAFIVLSACQSDVMVGKQSVCDGVKNGGEVQVDDAFDGDHDGYVDGDNPDCVENYAATSLDCEDGEAGIHPGAAELVCDGLDNDCDAATPDEPDEDGDGVDACSDCDDHDSALGAGLGVDLDGDGHDGCTDCDDTRGTVNPDGVETACDGLDQDCNDATPDASDGDGDGWTDCDECDDEDPYIFPGNAEICENATDDNCDGQVDEGCVPDFTGDWDLDGAVAQSCASGYVLIDFSLVEITDRNPEIRIYGEGANAQPGTMTGALTEAFAFDVFNEIAGTCTERYTMTGAFTSEDSFEAVFTTSFTETGPGDCYDCAGASWTVRGTRR